MQMLTDTVLSLVGKFTSGLCIELVTGTLQCVELHAAVGQACARKCETLRVAKNVRL